MKFTFDSEEIKLSSSTIEAIRIFMLLFIQDMRNSPNHDPECWTWGLATFNDFCQGDSIVYEYGGDEDIPVNIKENQTYVHI